MCGGSFRGKTIASSMEKVHCDGGGGAGNWVTNEMHGAC